MSATVVLSFFLDGRPCFIDQPNRLLRVVRRAAASDLFAYVLHAIEEVRR